MLTGVERWCTLEYHETYKADGIEIERGRAGATAPVGRLLWDADVGFRALRDTSEN